MGKKWVLAIVVTAGAALAYGPLTAQDEWKEAVISSTAPAKPPQQPQQQQRGPLTDGDIQEAITLQNAFTKVADMVRPAVVNVSTVYVEKGSGQGYEFFFGQPFDEFFDDFFNQPGQKGQQGQGQQRGRSRRQPRERKLEGTGSGVLISADGYVLTNEHVVRDAKDITVILDNEKKFKAKVAGKDERTDIAILKINAGKDLPYAKLGDSDQMKVGEWVLAIGSPFGLQHTVTAGIVSAVRQSLPIEGRDYRDLIQTDAAINRGNSGGPLCNIRGEVIGINTAIYAPTGVFSGVGFAIPVNTARRNLNELISKGRIVRGWLGVEIRPVDDVIAREFNIPDKKGVLVNNVVQGSPAAKAGLQRGDIIREFNGKSVGEARQLQDAVAQTEPKKKVTMRIIRNGREMTLPLVTGEMPAPSEEEEKAPEEEEGPQQQNLFQWQGMSVTPLTPALARRFEVPTNEKGVVVAAVDPGSPASEMGIEPGDLVKSVNRTATPDLKTFQSVSQKVNINKGMVLDIIREGHSVYVTYSPESQQKE